MRFPYSGRWCPADTGRKCEFAAEFIHVPRAGIGMTTLTVRLVRLQDRQFSVAQKSSKALVEGY